MKKVIFFCLGSFLSYQLLAQPFEKKQITNFNYDSRGASFTTYPLGLTFYQTPPLFFEVHDGDKINIMMLSYDSNSDSFFNPIPLTEDNFKNMNPIVNGFDYYPAEKINLIWQTNENGNWDIVMKTLTDSTWNEKQFLLSSSADEGNPQNIVRPFWNNPNNFDIDLVYERDNSIYLYQQKDSLTNHELIMGGNDTIIYSQPSGGYTSGLYVAATCKTRDSTSIIVYRYKPYGDSIWSEIKTAYDSGYCDNPKFFNNYDDIWLSFERTVASNKQVYLFPDLQHLGQNDFAVGLLDDQTINTSNLTLFTYGIVGGLSKNKQYDFYGPHTYKIILHDSVYVYIPNFLNSQLQYSKISDTKIGLGNLGISSGYGVSYVIWEDSSNGHINLFGVKRLDPIGDVNDKIIVNNFTLYQNYPNPFNPKTVIKYALLSRDYVSLKVFDVLGNEISTLINEEKSAGEYSMVFDGSNLASGIYVYILSVGNYHLSRKMILLK